MTEAEWLTSTSVDDLLYYATYGRDPLPSNSMTLRLDVDPPPGHIPPTPRQLALAVVGWVQHSKVSTLDETTADAARLLVLGADGKVGPEGVAEFRTRHPETVSQDYDGIGSWAPFILWRVDDDPLPVEATEAIAELLAPLTPLADQCAIFRDIFGNPFRRVADAGRFAPAVVRIASEIYADQIIDRLPILGAALRDAGCEDEQLIGHCRSAGPHVRGCWAVDLVMGKKQNSAAEQSATADGGGI